MSVPLEAMVAGLAEAWAWLRQTDMYVRDGASEISDALEALECADLEVGDGHRQGARSVPEAARYVRLLRADPAIVAEVARRAPEAAAAEEADRQRRAVWAAEEADRKAATETSEAELSALRAAVAAEHQAARRHRLSPKRGWAWQQAMRASGMDSYRPDHDMARHVAIETRSRQADCDESYWLPSRLLTAGAAARIVAEVARRMEGVEE